jgi:DNA repair exonuclease SbcCD ATPase subunit
VDKGEITRQTRALGKKIASQRKDLDKSKFAEADKLLADIEKAADNLAKAPPAQKDQALVELNKLSDALKEREKQLGSPEQIRRQLQQLKEMSSMGPGDDFARDLARGDFPKAAEELKKLQDKLMAGKMGEAEKKALKDQVAEMAKQLEKLANLDERKKQLEQALKNGGLSKEQFEREMAKLDDQTRQLQQLQKLAGQLAKAQEAMEKGDMRQAAQAMAKGQQQLSEMAQQLQELESLDGALAELQDAKNGMTGDQMNQLGESLGQFGRDPNNRAGQNGLGRGRGRGDRPLAPDSTALYNTKVAQQFKKGKAIVEGTSPFNKATKGQSIIEIQGELEVSEGLSAEALTNQKIPKNVEKHIRGYFDQINKGR